MHIRPLGQWPGLVATTKHTRQGQGCLKLIIISRKKGTHNVT